MAGHNGKGTAALKHCMLLAILPMICGCNWGNGSSSQTNPLIRIQKDTGLTFPANSAVIHFVEPSRMVDPIWAAKITMPASSYATLSRQLSAKTPDTCMFTPGLPEAAAWWKPTPANIIQTRQYREPTQQTFVYVAAAQEGKQIAVYVECVVD